MFRLLVFLLKKNLSLRGLALTLVLCFFVFAFFSRPLSFELKKENLADHNDFPEDKIQNHLKQYKNHFLWQVPLKKILEEIEEINPGLDLYMQRRYPNQLIISFKKKETALLLLTTESDLYSVAQDGSLGTQKEKTDSLNAPILRGKNFEEDRTLRKKALEFLKPIPPKNFIFSLENLSEILYEKKEESFLIHLSTQPLFIKLPPLLSNQKIKNIEFVLKYLQKEGKTHSFIDASFDKKIIVKKQI